MDDDRPRESPPTESAVAEPPVSASTVAAVGGTADGDEARPSTARGSITVAAWTLISRITGLLRVVVIGAVLGPTFFANAFLSANTVPGLATTALAGPVLALVLVPTLVRSMTEHGMAASVRLLSRINGYMMFWSSITAGALTLASPLVALAVTAGVPDGDTRWRAWRLTILVLLFVGPQILCFVLATIGAAVQQARGRFALSSAAPALENVGLIATMAVVWVLYDSGLDVPDVPVSMVLVLSVGATLSVALHAAAQLFGAHRAGLPMRVRGGWRSDPEARAATYRLRRSVIVAVFPVLAMFAMVAVAATVPGGVFVFQTALAVYFVIAALGSKAVTSAALPGLSAAARDGDSVRFSAAWRQALNYSLMASLPALCLLLAFAEPVAATLANGELHNPTVIGWLTGCLMVLAVSQCAQAVYETARQTLFARLDTRGPRRSSTVLMVVRMVVALSTLLLPADGYRLVGLTCAVLAADVAAAVITVFLVRKDLGPERLFDLRRLAVIGVAVLAMLPAAGLGSWLVQHLVDDRWPRVAVSLATGAVAVACFGLVFALLSGQLPALLAQVRARLGPR